MNNTADDWRSTLKREWRPLGALALIAALILFSYALARGPSESLFLKHYPEQALPGLWVEIGLAAALVVSLYNRALQRLSLPQIFQGAYALTALSLMGLTLWGELGSGADGATLELFGLSFPYGRATLLRIWSDLYIVVLVETYWSLANLYFPLKAARYLYGGLCAAGTLGSMAGNLFVRSYATTWSTESLILLVFPSLALMSALTIPLGRAFMRRREALKRSAERPEREQTGEGKEDTEGTPVTRPEGEAKRSDLISGLKVIARSDYLLWVLWLVLISQIAVTLIDYQYKAYLRELYPNTDARTAFQGLLYLSIDVGSLLMQVMTGLILSALGVGVTLSLIPLILLGLSLSPAVLPAMIAIASAKSASKFLTYSIFKSAKELLYFPLSYEEQTQGKAVIDILIYRQAKILASVLLLTLGALGWGLEEVKWLTALSLCLWLMGALMLLRATRRAEVDR